MAKKLQLMKALSDSNTKPISNLPDYGHSYSYNTILKKHSITIVPDGESPNVCFRNDKYDSSTLGVYFNRTMLGTINFPCSELLYFIHNKDKRNVSLYCNGAVVNVNYDESGSMTSHTFDLAAKMSSILSKTNTIEYTPMEEYNPATKKYVDDEFDTLATEVNKKAEFIERVTTTSTDTTVTLDPGKLYIFPEMDELTLTLAEPADTGVANEYHVIFQSGATATILSIPDTINVPAGFTVDANKIYELSIMEGCMLAQSWEVQAGA